MFADATRCASTSSLLSSECAAICVSSVGDSESASGATLRLLSFGGKTNPHAQRAAMDAAASNHDMSARIQSGAMDANVLNTARPIKIRTAWAKTMIKSAASPFVGPMAKSPNPIVENVTKQK